MYDCVANIIKSVKLLSSPFVGQQNRVAFFRDSAILAHIISCKLDAESKVTRVAYGVWVHTLKNYHRWTALFLRDRHSNFLSKDRAVVVYAFVVSTIAISAVFYGQQTAQSFILTALISALAAGVPAYVFKIAFTRCRYVFCGTVCARF